MNSIEFRWIVRFLSSRDILSCLFSCRKLLIYGFENEEVSNHLLSDLAAQHHVVIQLEQSPAALLRGLTGLPSGTFRNVSFKLRSQRSFVANVSMDSFPIVLSSQNNNKSSQQDWQQVNGGIGQVGSGGKMNYSLIPFSSLSRERSGESVMRLTTIKYFELLCHIEANASNSTKSPPNPQAIKFCFGISTSRMGNDLNSGQEYYLYKQSGRIIHNKNTLADGPYYRFHSGDVVGCGIVYAPIGGSNGQIFFTKNGEVVYLGELGHSNINWFPFAVRVMSFVSQQT